MSKSLVASASSNRVLVDGKFFRLGQTKFYVKGITYGPFAPNAHGEMFASSDQTRRDFEQIAELGANVLRLYYVPPLWFADLATERNLKLLIDIPWAKHLCFLDSEESQREARNVVVHAVKSLKGHSAVFAYSVVNEIAADTVRWSGVARTEQFIDELIDAARNADPHPLFTFTSFPPTEFLSPQNIDFVCFNVYLHQQAAFEAYLARLQTLADAKPLVLGEFGMDSMREGEQHKCEFLRWQIESAFKAGLAGTVVFSYTDDWFRGGMQIEDWGFGITTKDRQPKQSFRSVQVQYRLAPHFPLPKKKKVSVVVATYNGARTLEPCLRALTTINYPDYEIILVDDGSTDATPDIAKRFPSVRYIGQANHGLSVARNTGIASAGGEIIAFTDADCRPDEDWLYYLVNALLDGNFTGVGGHNFLPPDDSYVAAAVAASPGGPAHVMLTDLIAEHVPGCNMAFYKSALDRVGGFDPVFRKAGDDVDLCWRLQANGDQIGFSPGGFVWHYRRSTIKAYLRQQAGYGEAEALLAQKHPEHFNSFGQGIWRGRIYSAGQPGVLVRRAVIYHGPFGSGFFQHIYRPDPALPLMLATSLPFHTFANLPLLFLSAYVPALWPLAAASISLSIGVCIAAAVQARLSKQKQRLWSRSLIAALFFLQPIVRGWHRFKWRLNLQSTKTISLGTQKASADLQAQQRLSYWSDRGPDRYSFLNSLLSRLEQHGWSVKSDTGWQGHDAEIVGSPWTRLRLGSVTEELEQGRRNIHCSLTATWSLLGKLLFSIAAFAECLIVLVFSRHLPGLWMSPLGLYLIYWFFEDEKAIVQSAVVTVMDQTARHQHWVKLQPASQAELDIIRRQPFQTADHLRTPSV